MPYFGPSTATDLHWYPICTDFNLGKSYHSDGTAVYYCKTCGTPAGYHHFARL
jgi:hypothetical protein